MKVTTNKSEIKFPKLMIDQNDNMIILAIGKTEDGEYYGTVLDSGIGACAPSYPIGRQVLEDIPFPDVCNFVDLIGVTVTLSN